MNRNTNKFIIHAEICLSYRTFYLFPQKRRLYMYLRASFGSHCLTIIYLSLRHLTLISRSCLALGLLHIDLFSLRFLPVDLVRSEDRDRFERDGRLEGDRYFTAPCQFAEKTLNLVGRGGGSAATVKDRPISI